MKITSLEENLKKGLFIVSNITGKNVNLPILNNVLIGAKNGNIKFITTNLEMGIIHAIRGKIEKEGEYTVDAKLISDYINLLPNKKVDLEQKENELKINCENYKTKIKGQVADDYPLIPEVDKSIFYKAKISDFHKALSQVIFAVSTSESRLELSGVLFTFTDSNLVMASTDSYRLAEKKVTIETNSGEAKKAIIPARTLQELIRIMSADPEGNEITFYLTDNQVLFTYGTTELVSRLIEGQYPDYEQIIPNNTKTTIEIEQKELVRATKVAALFSKTGINDINLDFPEGKNKVIVSAVSGQTGENITELGAKVTGKDNSIVVNCRYLLEGLNNLNSEIIKLEIIDSNTPCILKPENDDSYLYIIMPIKQ